MKADILENIQILQENIAANTETIRLNRAILHDVLVMPLSDERTKLFIKHFEKNCELFSKNYDYIKLQFELHRFSLTKNELKTFAQMSLS